MSKNIEKSYILIKHPNTFTFIDNIKNVNPEITDFYLDDENFERIINFDLNLLINDIKKSFNSSNQKELIWKQFLIDAKRSNVYINNKYIQEYNLENIVSLIKSRNKNISDDLIQKILILSTQGSFSIPFSIIQNNLKKQNYFLSELTKEISEKYNAEKKMINSIYIGKEEIILENKKNLRIFKLENCNDKTVNIVRLNLLFHLNNPQYCFFKLKFNFI